MTFRRPAASFVSLAVLATFAAHGADAITHAPTQVSRIAGSLLQSSPQPAAPINRIAGTASPSVQAIAGEPGDPESITAVCITSGANSARCGATTLPATTTASGCQESGQYQNDTGSIDEPSSWCHGHAEPSYAHAPHVAVCDVDDVGLGGCLEKYASSLVKHADRARYVYQFNASEHEQPAITVLVTAKQTERDAQQMALDSASNTSIVSTH